MRRKEQLKSEDNPNGKTTTVVRLSLQEKIFCEAYIAMSPMPNLIKCAVRAGYKQPNASATQLMGRPHVVDYIDALRADARRRNNVTVDDIISEYMKIAFSDIREMFDEQGNLIPIHKLNDVVAASIKHFEIDEEGSADDVFSSRTKKISRHDKLTALNALRELLGFKEREVKIKRDAAGNVIETEETVNPDRHEVIFTDNSLPTTDGDM